MSDIATVTSKPEEKRPGPPLLLRQLDLLGIKRQVWTASVPAGATAEDLLRFDFWKLVSEQLNRHDILYVLADDESWECECRVEKSSNEGAEVSVVKRMKRKSFSASQTILGDGNFVTVFEGGCWNVRRIKDGVFVIRGHANENSAIMDWLRTQPKKMT